MFIGVSPFFDHLIMSNFTSMVMTFLFFDGLPSEESALGFGAITKGKKLKKNNETCERENQRTQSKWYVTETE